MKLLIVTDLEGVSGVVDWDKHDKASAEEAAYLEFLMTNDVNGAVEGTLAAGDNEVWVAECHKIDIRQIHPEAMLFKNSTHRMTPKILGMEPGKWDAMAFIGNHSMAETEKGVLCHTQNRRVKSIHLNDILVGEFGIQAAIAGSFGMPMIMVSGDKCACDQAKELIPQIETAAVKYGTSEHSAWCLTPSKAKELIANKMKNAVEHWQEIPPFIIEGPVTLREEMLDGTIKEYEADTAWEVFEKRCKPN
jgi:D-amino peptidase